MYHRFNVEVATRYGVPCALVLGHIDYLVEKARMNGEKRRNGKFWVNKSVKKISELYPYYSENTVRRAVERLRHEKLIETGHFPTNECPSTLWYTLTKKGKTMLQKGGDDLAELPNQNGTSAETMRHESQNDSASLPNQNGTSAETMRHESQNDSASLPNQNGTSAETSTKELIDPLIGSLVDSVDRGCRHQDIDINPFGDDNDDDYRPNFDTVEIYASSNLRSLTGGNLERLQSFIAELPDELIRYAIDKACGLGHPFFGYVQPILQQYVELGFKTVAEVEAYEEERKRRKGGNANGEHRGHLQEDTPKRLAGETIV